MNAVIMDDVTIGDECIVGALSFVKAGTQIPNRKMVVGNPATIIKDVSDEMIDWKTKGTALYQQLPKECYETLKAVEPLREIPANRPTQEAFYKTLEEFKSK
jgi:carbonic anhydrase/acetyltransferase-like protein (isoleucine patch superfamily)